MIKAEFDMAKLELSLKKAAKAFGDTTTQAVARWSVQTGRELAGETSAHGRGTDAKKKQHSAIEAGANMVIWKVSITGTTKGGNARFAYEGQSHVWPAERVIKSVSEFDDWIEKFRTGKNRYTKRPHFNELAICDEGLFKKALKARQMRAGIAKGAWLGAANKAATFQRGAQRINIGKNFLGYAQKHAGRGTAKVDFGAGFRPSGKLENRSEHSGKSWVLSSAKTQKALGWGLRKTITWYRKAAKLALDQ